MPQIIVQNETYPDPIPGGPYFELSNGLSGNDFKNSDLEASQVECLDSFMNMVQGFNNYQTVINGAPIPNDFSIIYHAQGPSGGSETDKNYNDLTAEEKNKTDDFISLVNDLL